MKLLDVNVLEEEAQYLRMLIYGEPGSGKSWFCASAALDEATAPLLYLDYHGQVTSLQSNPVFKAAMERGDLVILRIEKYEDLNPIYAWLRQGGKGIPQLDELFPHPPKTLAIDSVTELQRAEVMRRAGNAPNTFLTDVESPQIRDWGELLNQFTLLAKLFYDLPLNVVFSALESVQLNEKERVTSRRPAFQGAAKRLFPAYALTVMHLERAREGFNVGHTRDLKARSKDQSGVIPAVIKSPTIPKLAALLSGNIS